MDDWVFGTLDIYNYNKHGSKHSYFEFVRNNYTSIPGDIVEVGVYNGRSLIAMGLLLKELGSDKQIYGFDNFVGLSELYHLNDDISQFDGMFCRQEITEEHLKLVHKLQDMKKSNVVVNSGDFDKVDLDLLSRKIKYLGLDNISLVVGNYQNTMMDGEPYQIMSALIDCDLYDSYRISLPFVWERLVKDGYIYLDEYYSLKYPGGRIAVNEFFSDKKDKPQMHNKLDGDFERWYVRRKYA